MEKQEAAWRTMWGEAAAWMTMWGEPVAWRIYGVGFFRLRGAGKATRSDMERGLGFLSGEFQRGKGGNVMSVCINASLKNLIAKSSP